jgi:hypothetical protein
VRPALPDLRTSIVAADHAARALALTVRSLADDPFRLDLPPLAPIGGDIDAPAMDVLGGLYLIAMLEQTGMIRSAELLAAERVSLDVRDLNAAQRLDDYAERMTRWHDERSRNLLYARVFGIGAAAAAAGNSNTSFEGMLLELCSAITSWDDANYFNRPPATRRTTQVVQAVRLLRANLAPRQHGNTLIAARTVADQVRASHDLLDSPGVVALIAGRGMWDVVRALWGSSVPNIAALVTSGQSGQHVIGWAGTPAAETGEPTTELTDAAALWLSSIERGAEEAA